MAKEFKVSTDYILGLSTMSVRKSYEISELGLSSGAVKGLVTGEADVVALVANQIEKVMPLDKETSGQFQQLMKKMMEQAGK